MKHSFLTEVVSQAEGLLLLLLDSVSSSGTEQFLNLHTPAPPEALVSYNLLLLHVFVCLDLFGSFFFHLFLVI